MANSEAGQDLASAIPLHSHDAALCIIPPKHLWPVVDNLRALYDKAYGKWPPHVNLLYPFVRVESLEKAVSQTTTLFRREKASTDAQLHCSFPRPVQGAARHREGPQGSVSILRLL